MPLNRDSFVWWLAIAGALVTYLVSKETPPTAWGYMDWLQFASAAVATASAKLATSPLAGKENAQ
jgi:hypothetical protein